MTKFKFEAFRPRATLPGNEISFTLCPLTPAKAGVKGHLPAKSNPKLK
jgi:hypothetical protein